MAPIFSETGLYGLSFEGGLFKIDPDTFSINELGAFAGGHGQFVVDNTNGIIYVVNNTFPRNVLIGYRLEDGKLSYSSLGPHHNNSYSDVLFDPKANEVVIISWIYPDQHWTLSRVDPRTNTSKTAPDFKAPYTRAFNGITYDYNRNIIYAFEIGGDLSGYDGVTGKELVHVPVQSHLHYQDLEFDPKTGLVFGIYTGDLGQPHISSWNPETGEIKEILSLPFRHIGMGCSASLDLKTRLFYADCGYLTIEDFSELILFLFVVDIDTGVLVHESPQCKPKQLFGWCPDHIVAYYR